VIAMLTAFVVSRDRDLPLFVLFSAVASAWMVLCVLGLSLCPQSRGQAIITRRFPATVDVHAHVPLVLVKAVIVPFEVVMVWKTNDDIDASARVIDKLDAAMVVVFASMAVGRGVGRRSMSDSFAAFRDNGPGTGCRYEPRTDQGRCQQ
jgi:hypothetical protein